MESPVSLPFGLWSFIGISDVLHFGRAGLGCVFDTLAFRTLRTFIGISDGIRMGATRPIPRGYFGLGPKVTKTPLKGGGTL
ncbi:MAG: hypothetical protein FWE32_08155, partial [Oscillospiraceae bacterium]|nr:hypothetical protein [Oscillospiraceae bacterium]